MQSLSELMQLMLLQYVNPAGSKALNYSAPGELVGRHVDEALTSDKNPIEVYSKIQSQLESGLVRTLRVILVTRSPDPVKTAPTILFKYSTVQ